LAEIIFEMIYNVLKHDCNYILLVIHRAWVFTKPRFPSQFDVISEIFFVAWEELLSICVQS